MFKPMRSCAPATKYPLTYPAYASRKLDGIRFVVHKGKALSKSGKPIANNYIRLWIEENVFEGADGEIVSGAPNLETTYGSTFSAVMTQEGRPEFSLYLFDLCDRPGMAASERLTLLRTMVAEVNLPSLVFVDQLLVNSQGEFEEVYSTFLSEGYEGAILKKPNGLYKYGRSTPKDQIQLKFKPEEDKEARVTAIYEAEINNNESYINEVGETQRSSHAQNKVGKGMVGGFLATDLETGLPIKVAAGRLTHEERTKIFQEPAKVLGRLVRYRSMAYGTMTNGQPRHGRWIGWRAEEDM